MTGECPEKVSYIIPTVTNCAFRRLKKAQFVTVCGITPLQDTLIKTLRFEKYDSTAQNK
jgi:hypothetical protein